MPPPPPLPLLTVDQPAATQVKTQRALNDYRKSAFPHYKDEISRLRYIGVVSANRLKDARAHLGADVPIGCVDTVEDLKKLLEYADTNRCVCVFRECCGGASGIEDAKGQPAWLRLEQGGVNSTGVQHLARALGMSACVFCMLNPFCGATVRTHTRPTLVSQEG
jgi:hypothetical protein